MKTREEKIEDFLSELDTEVDVSNMVNADEVNSYQDVYETIDQGGGFDVDVIYYSYAIHYLAEHDPSLCESIGIAEGLGYETGSINSKLLARLLKSQNVRDEFWELESEIDEFFEELEDKEDDKAFFIQVAGGFM